MDSRKKLIYTSIISVCIIATAIVLLWGGGGVPGLPTDDTVISDLPVRQENTGSSAIKPNPDGTYPAPAVFPSNTNLDTQLLDSSGYKLLVPNNKLKLEEGDLGRDNPFGDY